MGDESGNGPSPIRTNIANAAFSGQSEFFHHAITSVNLFRRIRRLGLAKTTNPSQIRAGNARFARRPVEAC